MLLHEGFELLVADAAAVAGELVDLLAHDVVQPPVHPGVVHVQIPVDGDRFERGVIRIGELRVDGHVQGQAEAPAVILFRYAVAKVRLSEGREIPDAGAGQV